MPRWSFLAVLALTLPAIPALAQDAKPTLLPPTTPIEQAVDHYIDAELAKEKVKPAAPADDAELLRRLTLDLAGRIPTTAEVAEYLGSTDPQKKTKLVDRLIASPGFVRHQAQELYTLLQIDENGRKKTGKTALRDYLQTCVAENRSWDRIFREVMLPDDGNPKASGAGEFLKVRVKDLNKLTIDVSTTFFGVNVSCAQCHDHPHVRDWTQDHFYGLKSFFARTFESGGVLGEYDAGLVKYIPNKGKEKVAPVMFLTGKAVDVPNVREPNGEEKKQAKERVDKAKKEKKAPAPPAYSLRAKLVETALEPGQRDFFARAAVNRLWHRLYGRGLVMPLDQMHSANPASHPELLDWLARDFVEHGYDLRRVVRGLVLSNAYARASRWDGESPPPDKLFAVALARPMSPTQMASSLRLATTDPESLPKAPAELEKRLQALEQGAEKYAGFFAQPGDNFQVSVGEAMLFANNEAIQKELLAGAGTLATRLKDVPEAQRPDLAVRTVLGRPARPEEAKAITEYVQRRTDRTEAACQQVVWALLTSAEFRFNH